MKSEEVLTLSRPQKFWVGFTSAFRCCTIQISTARDDTKVQASGGLNFGALLDPDHKIILRLMCCELFKAEQSICDPTTSCQLLKVPS
ncbi:hypothetical protein PROFUN_08863 [Planoprotostelium fungivorum]|uniref:Uncharacterized protein n=1 Tax=Planoprotostelium fungivorum TaxID=1890364 RepID=A0A2P6NIZ6_9EUKA|nr:hypothetical protein PROFUN_08863 [Planoprotostelium fungivorum]